MRRAVTIILFLALLFHLRPVNAQTDTEFWLSIPEINRIHRPGDGGNDGKPYYLHITARNLPTVVTIEMPGYGGFFPPVTLNLPPNTTQKLDLSPWIADDVATENNIETTLRHSLSNTAAPQPFINRSNKGVHITSTAPITAYLEVSVLFNRELIALKGRNGLGKLFYIPFQTRYSIHDYNLGDQYKPYSSFDIVASEDNTQIRITPTEDVWVANNLGGGDVQPANIPFDIWLNRGQVAIITPYEEDPSTYYQTSFTKRLAGSKVEVLSGDENSNKVSIITREDLVRPIEGAIVSNDVDYIADQLVPVELLGTHYAIVRGMTEEDFEYAYVVGIQDNTTYSVNGGPDITINEMESHFINIPYNNHITTITSSHPIYVYHSASADEESQLGGAIIPTISYCTGSTRVAFNRTSAAESNGYFELILNILVRRGAEGSFVLLDEDENDVTNLVNGLGNPISFQQVPGDGPYSDWLYARFPANNLNTDVAYQLLNTSDVFHLGLLNGYHDGDNFYGYFSDFNTVDVTANIAGFGGTYVACFGEPVQLVAAGGVNYQWDPPTFLDDPTSATPIALPDTSIKYTVTVSGACQVVDSADVFIYLSDPVHAIYTLEENVSCSPFILEVVNESIGVDHYIWDMGDGSQPYTWAPGYFEYLYLNESDTVQEFEFRLVGRSNFGCEDTLTTNITVFPEVTASAQADIITGCAPLEVDFSNFSQRADAYLWRFGDGSTSSQESPTHVFHNYTDKDTVYTVVLTSRSIHGCADRDTLYIHVNPYVETGFHVTPHVHCHPYPATFTNTSFGTTSNRWSFDGGNSFEELDSMQFVRLFENFGDEPVVYQVLLEGENAYGCSDESARNITIYPHIESAFTPNVISGCDPLEVSFSNFSDGASSYLWDFDKGAGTSSAEEPVVVFDNPDTQESTFFNVSLLTTSDWGCTDTSFVEIEVFSALRANFTFDYTSYCTPQEITFSNNSAGGLTHYWDFGDGTPILEDNSSSVSHEFRNETDTEQVFPVRLVIENANGCVDEIVRNITIYPEVRAQAEMVSSGCHPLEVEFVNQSHGAVKYFWEFEDGASTQESSPTRIFTNTDHFTTKTYQVQMIAESQFGCRDTLFTQVVVNPKPKAGYSLSESVGCAPLNVDFLEESLGATIFSWDFGDGSPVSNTPGDASHLYFNTGDDEQNIITTLIVTNSYGCRDTLEKPLRVFPQIDAEIEVSSLSGCHPLHVDIVNKSNGASAATPYQWVYGDGNSSTSQQEVHAYVYENFSHTEIQSFTLKLNAESYYGCKDSTELIIEVFPRPRASFESDIVEGCSPLPVDFQDASLGGSSYQWSFGDGEQSPQQGDVSHVFNQGYDQGVGDFQVELLVTNQYDCSHSTLGNIRVYPDITADFDVLAQGCHPLEVNFQDLSLGVDEYSWTFGEGSSSNEDSPTFIFFNESFTQAKSYFVNLRTQSIYGCQADKSQEIVVYPRPESNFSIDQHHGCSPLEIAITNESIGSTVHSWNLDGNIISNNQVMFNHIFSNLQDNPVDVDLVLTATNEYGCSRISDRQVRVFPEVLAEFTADNSHLAGCSPLELNFENLSQRAHTYQWNFDDGNSATSPNPFNVFYTHSDQESHFQVLLHASSVYGCHDSIVKQVSVYPVPVADLFVSPHSQIFPDATVAVENLSAAGNWTYFWDLGDGTQFSTQDPSQFSHTFIWEPGDYATRYYRVYLMVGNEFCNDTISQRIVILAPEPMVGFSPSAQGCPPLDVQFRNATMYGKEFYWDFDDGNFSSQENPRHIFADPGVYRVKLLVSGEGGVDSAYQNITVFEPPIADFRPDKPVVQIPYESVKMINLSSLGAFYEWHMGDGHIYFDFEPEHDYESPGHYDITLIVSTDTQPQCFDSITKANAVIAEQPCQVIFPNAFTPNTLGSSGGRYVVNDPANHVFYPVHTGLSDYRMEIYNRWGEFIFRTTDVDIGWDGYFRGELAPMGVYVWKVWATCHSGKKIEDAGDVTLYR